MVPNPAQPYARPLGFLGRGTKHRELQKIEDGEEIDVGLIGRKEEGEREVGEAFKEGKEIAGEWEIRFSLQVLVGSHLSYLITNNVMAMCTALSAPKTFQLE